MREITPLYLLNIQQMPIYDQLRLEEGLLRADHRNWCLINGGSPPSIVMGISGKWEELIDVEVFAKGPVPVIRRFSGGGTVFVDAATHFITFICNSKCTETSCFPKNISQWVYAQLKPIFPELDFQLRENDFVHGDRKFGGNAQYLCKQRWLHHCSLLWDYRLENMQYLHLPQKKPLYRESRSHSDFLCCLKDRLPYRQVINERLIHSLSRQFDLREALLADVHVVLEKPHRTSTQFIFPVT